MKLYHKLPTPKNSWIKDAKFVDMQDMHGCLTKEEEELIIPRLLHHIVDS